LSKKSKQKKDPTSTDHASFLDLEDMVFVLADAWSALLVDSRRTTEYIANKYKFIHFVKI